MSEVYVFPTKHDGKNLIIKQLKGKVVVAQSTFGIGCTDYVYVSFI